MKTTLKVRCEDKLEAMEFAVMSVEQKQKNEYTYLFYEGKRLAKEDMESLVSNGYGCELFEGWEVDGFVTFTK